MNKDKAIPVDVGNMRHRIVIRHGIRVPDGMGGYTLDSGAVYQTVWAEVIDNVGNWDKSLMGQVETQYKKKLGEIDFFLQIEAEASERDKI